MLSLVNLSPAIISELTKIDLLKIRLFSSAAVGPYEIFQRLPRTNRFFNQWEIREVLMNTLSTPPSARERVKCFSITVAPNQ